MGKRPLRPLLILAESAGLEAGLPVFVVTPCFVFVGDTLGVLSYDPEASELTDGQSPFQLSRSAALGFQFSASHMLPPEPSTCSLDTLGS